MEYVDNARPSGRYPGYVRVKNVEYCHALLTILTEEAADPVEAFGMEGTIADLRAAIGSNPGSASSRLKKEILSRAGARSVFDLNADEFKGAAEEYYRTGLCEQHTTEAFPGPRRRSFTDLLGSRRQWRNQGSLDELFSPGRI